MKLAFTLPHSLRIPAMMQPWEAAVTGADQTAMIKQADAMGYDMVAVPEHFLIAADQVDLSGSHYFHASTAQAYLAGATERILVNSCCSVLPLQHPVVTAKALATADWLSSGRMMVTFGVGWMPEEFEVLGVPFTERGRVADEYLAAIVELWTSDRPSFHGQYVNFDEVAFDPKPVSKPHLPIWIGGDAKASMRRVARFGSGWWPFQTPRERIPEHLEFIKAQPEYDGRHLDVMIPATKSRIDARHEAVTVGDVVPSSAAELIDELNAIAELGATFSSVRTPPVSGIQEHLDYAQWVIEEVKPYVD